MSQPAPAVQQNGSILPPKSATAAARGKASNAQSKTEAAITTVASLLASARAFGKEDLQNLKAALPALRDEQLIIRLFDPLIVVLPQEPALAASCLSSLLSLAPSTTLKSVTLPVVQAAVEVIRLGTAQLQAIVSVLRLLWIAIERSTALPADLVQRMVQALRHWLFYQHVAATPSAIGQLRQRAAPFHGPALPMVAPPRRRRGSDTSITSDGSNSTIMRGEGGGGARARVEALACLKALDITFSSHLRSQWFLFMPEDAASSPSLLDLLSDSVIAVRIAACETLNVLLKGAKSFLAAAQDSAKHASFTSLSARLAFLVIEIHRVLGQSLASPADKTLTRGLLELIGKLATVSSYDRLQAGIASPLLRMVEPFLSQLDFRDSACESLITLLEAITPGSRQLDGYSFDRLESHAISLLDQGPAPLRPRIWLLLGAIARHSGIKSASVLERLGAGEDEVVVQAAQLRFVAASWNGANATGTDKLAASLDRYATSRASSTRKACCDCLAKLDLNDRSFTAMLNLLLDLCGDPEAAVRVSALRALGHQAQTLCSSGDQELIDRAVDLLRYRADDPTTLAARAWSFAAVVDAIFEAGRAARAESSQLADALCYAGPQMGEAVRSSGLRAIASAWLSSERQYTQSNVVTAALLAPLSDTAAVKIQWNALTSLARILPSVDCATDIITPLTLCLSASGNLKVRIAAVQALQAALPTSKHDAAAVVIACRTALLRLDQEEEDLPYKEMTHARALREALEACIRLGFV